KTECAAIVTLAICIVKIGVPVPSWVIWIQLLGARGQSEPAFEVARINKHFPNKCNAIAIHRIQCGSPFRRIPEAFEFLLEKEDLRKTEMRQVIGWRLFYGTLRSGRSSRKRVGEELEPLPISLRV